MIKQLLEIQLEIAERQVRVITENHGRRMLSYGDMGDNGKTALLAVSYSFNERILELQAEIAILRREIDLIIKHELEDSLIDHGAF